MLEFVLLQGKCLLGLFLIEIEYLELLFVPLFELILHSLHLLASLPKKSFLLPTLLTHVLRTVPIPRRINSINVINIAIVINVIDIKALLLVLVDSTFGVRFCVILATELDSHVAKHEFLDFLLIIGEVSALLLTVVRSL